MFLLLVTCGPSREEREASATRQKESAAADTAAAATATATLEHLQGIVEITRTHCATEFQRIATEKLGPATEGKGCELTPDAFLPFTLNATSPTIAGIGAPMQRRCDEYVKDLELRVRQTLFKKSSLDNEEFWTELEHTWLVGVVYEKIQRPEVKTEAVGTPHAFVPGKLAGVGYLYSVGTGHLACAGAVDASSSEKVETFKRDDKGIADVEADLEVAADLATQAGASLKAGHTWPLIASDGK